MSSTHTKLLSIVFFFCSIHFLPAQFTIVAGTGGTIDNTVVTNYFPLTATGLTCNHITDGTRMDITHPDLASLSISLVAPDGTTVLLTENQVSGTSFDNTGFSLNSMNDISTASPPYPTFYQPIEPIANFNNGQDLNGTWQLAISFSSPITTTGTVDHWEMGFFLDGTDPCTTPPMNCPPNLDVPDILGNNTFEAGDTLTSNAIISAMDSVNYFAGASICLNDGFEIQLGAKFLAEIQDCGSGNLLPAGESSFTIPQIIDGVVEDRLVSVRAPTTTDPNAMYPLLFYFHGNGGTGANYLNNQDLNTIIDNENVIGIYPQGFNNAWNLGPEDSNADELEFIDLVMAQLATYDNVDLTKVYGIGSSNGAAILNEFARQRAYFNAIAPIVSQMNVNQALITPPREVAVYQINGDSDGLIPVNGGTSAVGQTFLSAQASAEDWAMEFSCDASPTTTTTDTWGSYPVNSYFYENCNSGVVVSYHILVGGTHGLAGGAGSDFTQRIWDFLKQY